MQSGKTKEKKEHKKEKNQVDLLSKEEAKPFFPSQIHSPFSYFVDVLPHLDVHEPQT